MKRTLVVLMATAGAAVLAFAGAANFFPDWTWKVLNATRNTKTKVLREKPAAIELSMYALPPGTSVEAEQVSCPSFATGFALHDYRAYGSDGSSRKYVDAFNQGDVEAMAADFARPASILDGLAPHLWQGASASEDWYRDV